MSSLAEQLVVQLSASGITAKLGTPDNLAFPVLYFPRYAPTGDKQPACIALSTESFNRASPQWANKCWINSQKLKPIKASQKVNEPKTHPGYNAITLDGIVCYPYSVRLSNDPVTLSGTVDIIVNLYHHVDFE